MSPLFFLSFLSIFLFMNTGQSAAADPKIPMSKKEKMRGSAEEFSKSVWLAHNKGITGRNLKAVIIEPDPPERSFAEKIKATILGKFDNETPDRHSEMVATSLLNIAPDSEIIFLGGASKLSDLPQKDREHLLKAHVINLSFTTFMTYTSVNVFKWINSEISLFQSILRQNKGVLFVKSAGNESTSDRIHWLSDPTDRILLSSRRQNLYTLSWYMAKDRIIGKNTILVGSINRDFYFSDFSSLPGSDPLIQENFLFALGEDLTINESKSISGTSFSAPTVSGAALLLKQEFPGLSMLDIKEILLESASKTFFCYDGTGMDRTLFFVYDEGEFPEKKISRFMNINRQPFDYMAFNPKYFGKGILDLRAAFVYARLKNQHRGKDLKQSQLRSEMKSILKKQDNRSATKIQALVRGHQARKRGVFERLRRDRKEKPEKPLKPRIGPKPILPPKPKISAAKIAAGTIRKTTRTPAGPKPRIGPKPPLPPKPKDLKLTPPKKPSVRDLIESFGKR